MRAVVSPHSMGALERDISRSAETTGRGHDLGASRQDKRFAGAIRVMCSSSEPPSKPAALPNPDSDQALAADDLPGDGPRLLVGPLDRARP